MAGDVRGLDHECRHTARDLGGRHADVHDHDAAGPLRGRAGDEASLDPGERRRQDGADGRAGWRLAVGRQAGGHVERHDRSAA
jgi:hypothetical protein